MLRYLKETLSQIREDEAVKLQKVVARYWRGITEPATEREKPHIVKTVVRLGGKERRTPPVTLPAKEAAGPSS